MPSRSSAPAGRCSRSAVCRARLACRVDPYRIHYEEVRLAGSFHHTPRQFRAALAFLASGAYPFERLVTHEVGLEGVAALFDDPPRDYLKAAVKP